MSLPSHPYMYHFFRNRALNHFHVAIAIIALGEALISIFVPIYLYKLNYPIHQIIFFYFLTSLGFVLFSYMGAKIVSRIGIKYSILASTPFLIIFYIGLKFIEQYEILFFILPLLVSIRMVLFNYAIHSDFLIHSQKKNRGKQISFFGILIITASMIAPLIGGLIASQGFSILYITGSIILFLGTIPLFFTKDKRKIPELNVKKSIKKIFSKNQRGNFISFSGFAIESTIQRVIWPIFLIIILISLEKTGLIVSISLLFSLVAFYIAGKITDKFNKNHLIKKLTIFHALSWVGRIFADSSLKILVVDSYKNITEKILIVPWTTHSYDLAIKENYFDFLVRRRSYIQFCQNNNYANSNDYFLHKLASIYHKFYHCRNIQSRI